MTNKAEKIKESEKVVHNVLELKMKTIFKWFFYYAAIPLILYGSYNLFLQYGQLLPFEIKLRSEKVVERRPTYWVYSRSPDTYYLKHVYAVLDRLGFHQGNNESDWDLLWAHDYPFRTLYSNLNNLKPYQKVNHFPGCGYITNKVDLSTSDNKYIPLAFRIPKDKSALLEYSTANPKKLFVQKSNAHRGIQVRNISDLDLSNDETFVQEFIDNPYLVDGYKFDIGVYTVITSIDPLRIYVYKADVLFRFCPKKYYPFDPEDVDKYVVGDDYLPIWNVPSLRYYYKELGLSMKDSFDAYVLSKGKDPYKMWNEVYDSIREITLQKEKSIRESMKRFGDGRNFFEMVRIDFTLDEDLNVYLMEANMSPNLSSAHFPPNQLLYEQVLFNLFALIGVGHRTNRNSLKPRNKLEEEMEVADKNLVVLPEVCLECEDCFRAECQLCKPCFRPEIRQILVQSYLEHQNKMDYLRIFPPPISQNMTLKDYTLKNQLLIRWFQGKCQMDSTWCN